MNKDKSIQLRISLGYLLIIIAAVTAIWYILSLTKEVNKPKEIILNENNRAFQLGSLISDFYLSESTSRVALSTLNIDDINRYEKKIDSLKISTEKLKEITSEDEIVLKLDSISTLLSLKKQTFKNLIEKRKLFKNSKHVNSALTEIQKERHYINDLKIDSTFDTKTSETKKGFFSRLSNVFTSKNDNEAKKIQEEKEKEILSLQIEKENEINRFKENSEKILQKAIINDNKTFENYLKEEEKLIQENVNFSHKIRDLVESVEKSTNYKWSNLFKSTTLKIEKVTNNIIYFGIITLLIIVILSIIIIRDINNNNNYKISLENSNKNLEEIMHQKNFFMASITHDMNAPLNTLFGFTELLENSLTSKKLKTYAKNIHYSASYFKNLIDDLSLFSKLEHNFVEIHNDTFDLNELITNVYKLQENSAFKKNIALNLKIDPEIKKSYQGDPHRITQILTNIISNAIKFTNQGSVDLEVESDQNGVKIKITDTGIGIHIENKNDIYKEFVQAHKDIEKNYGGTGLGLNISKRLIDLMGGTIDFESTLDKGTTFYLFIPLIEGIKSINQIYVEDAVLQTNQKLKNKNILVIDDDVLQLQLLKEILIDKVKSIDLLNDGRYLSDYLDAKQYDLIISDLQMPKYSGYQIIKQIRSHEMYKLTPVIAFSGKIDINETHLKEIGFDSILRKPINLKNLLTTIYQQLKINFDQVENIFEKNTNDITDIKPYSLHDLEDMFDNDKETIKNILKIFLENVHIDLQLMYDHYMKNDLKNVSRIAHKVLPMYRQIYITSQIECLEILERDIENVDKNELNKMLVNFFTYSDNILKLIKKIELD